MTRTAVLLTSILALTTFVLCDRETTTEVLYETGLPCNSNNKTDGSCRLCFCDKDGIILDCTAELCEDQLEYSVLDTMNYEDYGEKFECSRDNLPIHPCYRCFCNSNGLVFHCELRMNQRCVFRNGRRSENGELPCPDEVLMAVEPCVHCYCNSAGVIIRCDGLSCEESTSGSQISSGKNDALITASAVVFGVMEFNSWMPPVGTPGRVPNMTVRSPRLSASDNTLSPTLVTPGHSKESVANPTATEPLKEDNKYGQSDNAYRAKAMWMSDVISTTSANEKNLQESEMEPVVRLQSFDEGGKSKSLEDTTKAKDISKSDITDVPPLEENIQNPEIISTRLAQPDMVEKSKTLDKITTSNDILEPYFHSTIPPLEDHSNGPIEMNKLQSPVDRSGANYMLETDILNEETPLEGDSVKCEMEPLTDELLESEAPESNNSNSEVTIENEITASSGASPVGDMSLERSLPQRSPLMSLLQHGPTEHALDTSDVRKASTTGHGIAVCPPGKTSGSECQKCYCNTQGYVVGCIWSCDDQNEVGVVSECPAVYIPNPACQICLCDALGKILTCKWICQDSVQDRSDQSQSSPCPPGKTPNPECRTCQCDENGDVTSCKWTCRIPVKERGQFTECPLNAIKQGVERECAVCQCDELGNPVDCIWICSPMMQGLSDSRVLTRCPADQIPNSKCQICECEESGKISTCMWICHGLEVIHRSLSGPECPEEKIPYPECQKCNCDEDGNILQCTNMCIDGGTRRDSTHLEQSTKDNPTLPVQYEFPGSSVYY